MKTFLGCATAALFACFSPNLHGQQADDLLELRQIIIRAPELEVAELMTSRSFNNGEELYAALRQAVKAGRASVVADITTAAEGLDVKASLGRHVWLVSERDQDFDRLYLPPLGFQEFFVGTSLEARLKLASAKEGLTGVHAAWRSGYSPCGPALTRWPTSWLNLFMSGNPDPQHRLVRGWLDNYDVFREDHGGEHGFASSKMQLLAVAPPGDQTWPAEPRPGRWLDVFLAQIRPRGGGRGFVTPAKGKARALLQPADPFADAGTEAAGESFPDQQVMIYGIGLNASEAALLIAKRHPENDGVLLRELLGRVKADRARLHFCAGVTGQAGSRSIVTAAREHQYPTEMPSIPSAWEGRQVGTMLEVENREWFLDHHLAPPRRSEWRLALDDPQAVMWEPRFRSLKATAALPRKQGVQLASVQRIPDLMSGDGIAANETVLLFAQRTDEFPETVNQDDARAQPLEAELLVLEVPDAEPADFEKPLEDPFSQDDHALFENLLNRLKAGKASVAAHVMVSTLPRPATLSAGEEFMHATEFDPPRVKDVPRMRPTALETVHVGDLLKIDLAIPDPAQPQIAVEMSFQHSTGIPLEPSLEAALACAAKDELMRDYPMPEHPCETWSPGKMILEPGKVVFLGARKPPGVQRKVAHAAWLVVRKLP